MFAFYTHVVSNKPIHTGRSTHTFLGLVFSFLATSLTHAPMFQCTDKIVQSAILEVGTVGKFPVLSKVNHRAQKRTKFHQGCSTKNRIES